MTDSKKKKDVFIKIRCTEQERSDWNRAAEIEEKTLTNIVREAFNAQQTKVKNLNRRQTKIIKADPDLILAINRIGINMNQMARYLNYKKDDSDIEAVCFQLDKAYQQLLRVEELAYAHKIS